MHENFCDISRRQVLFHGICIIYGLIRIRKIVEREGRIKGLSCVKTGQTVFHLLFADDSLLFCRARLAEILRVKRGVISQYEEASGQKVNFAKSSISFTPNVDVYMRQFLQNALGVRCDGEDS